MPVAGYFVDYNTLGMYRSLFCYPNAGNSRYDGRPISRATETLPNKVMPDGPLCNRARHMVVPISGWVFGVIQLYSYRGYGIKSRRQFGDKTDLQRIADLPPAPDEYKCLS